jgi:hypothetical protein
VNIVPDPQISAQDPKRSKLPRNDEWLALIVAFGTIGGIAAYSTMRGPSGSLFSLAILIDRPQVLAQPSTSDSDADAAIEANSGLFSANSLGDRSALNRTAKQMESTIKGLGVLGGAGLAISEPSRSQAALLDASKREADQSQADEATASGTASGTASNAASDAVGLPEVAAGSASVATNLEATSSPVVFSDVADDRWSKPFIDGLSKRDLISGFPDGTFAPDRPVTRAELAAQIQKIFERDTNLRDSIAFTDVDTEYWGQAAIDKSVKIGFLSGYPNAIFAPDKSVSRLEVAVALATGLGLNPSDSPDTVLTLFPDAKEIPGWAKPKIAAATQAGFAVVDPELQKFDPSAPATREVVATMMYQALVWAQQAESIDSDRVVRP